MPEELDTLRDAAGRGAGREGGALGAVAGEHEVEVRPGGREGLDQDVKPLPLGEGAGAQHVRARACRGRDPLELGRVDSVRHGRHPPGVRGQHPAGVVGDCGRDGDHAARGAQ